MSFASVGAANTNTGKYGSGAPASSIGAASAAPPTFVSRAPIKPPSFTRDNVVPITKYNLMDVRDLLLYILWDVEHFAGTDHLRASIDVSEERMLAHGPDTKQAVWGLCTYLFHRLPNYTSELVLNTLATCSNYPLDKMPADGDVTSRRFVLEFACWVIRKVAPIEVGTYVSPTTNKCDVGTSAATVPPTDDTTTGGATKKRRVTVREGGED